MGRPLKKPEFDHEKIITEVLDGMVQAYRQLDKSQRSGGNLSYGALKDLADEMDMKPSKIRKLLITAGVRDNKEYYGNDASRLVLNLYREGKSNADIMKITGLGRASVLGYPSGAAPKKLRSANFFKVIKEEPATALLLKRKRLLLLAFILKQQW